MIKAEVASGKRSKFYGKRIIYYTGITNRLVRRFEEHFSFIKSRFLKKRFFDAQLTPVYVEYLTFGTNWFKREKFVKKLNQERKKQLINSDNNLLIKVEANFGRIKSIKLKEH